MGAARVGLIPVMLNATLTPAERDDLADDASPTVRVFTQPELHDLIETGDADRYRPVPADPPHALHVGHHRQAQGRHHRPVGRTHRATGLRGRGRASGTSTPTTCTWCARRCTTPSPSASPAARSWRAGRWPSSAASMRPPPSTPSGATDRRPRSSSRPTCTGYCRTPASARRAVRLAAPPRPRRGALSRHGQARHHGTSPARRRLGVLRLHRGPVLGVPTGGLARAPRHRRPGPPGPPPPHRPGRRRRPPTPEETRRAPSGATCPTSPASATGRTPRPRPPPGTGRRAPSATSAASMRTASST